MSGYILITRPESEAHNDAKTYTALGYKTWVEPLIKIEAIEHNEITPSKDQALIFTSANAVRLFETTNKTTPIYTVGNNTKEAAIHAGYTTITSADGNAADLLSMIQTTAPKETPLLFIRGKYVSSPLASDLKKLGYTITETIIYNATFTPEFSPTLVKHIQAGKITTITLYSKRTAKNLIALINQHNLHSALKKTKLLSISPSVLEYVHSQIPKKDWLGTYSAPQANKEGMLKLIKHKA